MQIPVANEVPSILRKERNIESLAEFPFFRSTTLPAADAKSLVYSDAATQAVVATMNQVARSRAAVLITGETGTGKEVFARYIHERSGRKGPLVAVNCGALSDGLADAELFGHEKGAYTGAVRSQIGWFEAAEGGTLLLDEIGELSMPLQVKLLRVLQEREVTRVGSRVPMPVDVRIIAATNVELSSAIAAKRFREDLYFRLKVASILIPPLRERSADVEALALHFLRRYGSEVGRPELSMSPEALDLLRRHPWPGNVRELENVIHTAVLYTHGPRIELEHLRACIPLVPPQAPESAAEALKLLFESCVRNREPDFFNRVMVTLVQSAFDLADGNQVRASEFLGISRHALRTQLAHLGIIPFRQRHSAKRRKALPWVGTGARDSREVRIGYQKYGTLSLVKAEQAIEQQFTRHRVRSSWTEFSAGPQLLEALQSGEIDFGSTGDVAPIVAQANGASFVYVGHEPPSPTGEALVVPRYSDIKTVADLRGRTIGLIKGSNAHYLLLQCLEAHGLSLEDIQLVNALPQDIVSQFKARTVDAWVAWDPFLTAVQKAEDVRILLDGVGLVSNHQFHLARKEFAVNQPSIIRILLDQLRKVGRWAASNPARAARRASHELGLDVSTLEIAISRLTHGAKPIDLGVIREQQKIADRFYALGLIPRAILIRDAVWSPVTASP
jgi:aliphatic sulfonates family ABC transporter substrate-binding protein